VTDSVVSIPRPTVLFTLDGSTKLFTAQLAALGRGTAVDCYTPTSVTSVASYHKQAADFLCWRQSVCICNWI